MPDNEAAASGFNKIAALDKTAHKDNEVVNGPNVGFTI
jgi:hypothetical protein